MITRFRTQARWFLRQLRPLLPAYSFGVLLIVLSSLLFLLDPLLLKWMIDYVLPRKDFRLLLLAATGFFGLYIFRLGLFTLAQLVNFRTIQNLVFQMRLGILEQMNRLSADYHEITPKRLYRLEQDVDQVAEVGSTLLPYVLQTAFNSIFVMGTISHWISSLRAWFSLSCLCSLYSERSSRNLCASHPIQRRKKPPKRPAFFKSISHRSYRFSSYIKRKTKPELSRSAPGNV